MPSLMDGRTAHAPITEPEPDEIRDRDAINERVSRIDAILPQPELREPARRRIRGGGEDSSTRTAHGIVRNPLTNYTVAHLHRATGNDHAAGYRRHSDVLILLAGWTSDSLTCRDTGPQSPTGLLRSGERKSDQLHGWCTSRTGEPRGSQRTQPFSHADRRQATAAAEWSPHREDAPHSCRGRLARDRNGVPRSTQPGSERVIPVLLRARRDVRIDADTAAGAPADPLVGRRTPLTGSHQRDPQRRPPLPPRACDGR
jgi:hypothetical protein